MNRNFNGDGSFFLASTGRYVYQYTEPVTHKVKRITQKKNETKKDFRDRANKIRAEINTDEYITGSSISIATIIEEQNQALLNANKIRPISYKRRTETLNRIKKMSIASMPIQEVTARLINEDLSTVVNYSDSTISKIFSAVASAFDYAFSYNIIKINPFSIKNMIIRPKSLIITKKVEAFTIDEQKAFEAELAKGYDEYTEVFYILLYTGMRVGEVLALNETDIDLSKKVIHVTKTLTKGKDDKVILR